jgi:agmatine deiminase
MKDSVESYSMPPEWAPHRATWIAWPHLDSDFPGKMEPVRWAFCELIRHLSRVEQVEVLCANESLKSDLLARLERVNVPTNAVKAHIVPYERTWLRDSAPTLVKSAGKNIWMTWCFNAWAKYDDYGADQRIPAAISGLSGIGMVQAFRPDATRPLVLEGGAFDVDGRGTIMVTEECLLSQDQERNPGLERQGYESAFSKFLGASRTIWLKSGCEGDDTHGHIDDIARFVAPGVVVINAPSEKDKTNYAGFRENLAILQSAKDANGEKLNVVEVPSSAPIFCDGVRLPASYMNFYIANGIVLVPTFNDANDRKALGILSELMPDREIVGINCVDWVLGYGSLHCSTQQEPI